MWGNNMKSKGSSKTLDNVQIQKKLKNTNTGKTDTYKAEEILKVMSTLKSKTPKP
jgi:hypothetical protein